MSVPRSWTLFVSLIPWLRFARQGGALWSLEYDGLTTRGLAAFILEHFDHGGFLVVSEYWQSDDPERQAKYPAVRVVPEMPTGEYRAMCLERARDDAKEMAARLLRLVDGE